MIYEIIGSRIVSPFLGSSTYIWTSLIGVILASLSLGYWLGGRVADKRPSIRYLAYMILIASGLVSLTAVIKEVVLAAIAGAPFGLELRSVLASLFLFAPASVCLGFVTPFAVRLRTMSVETTGRTVGRLYALSTIGSIAGTFAAGFFLIPFVGSVRTLYLIAGVLLAIGLLLSWFEISRSAIAGIVMLVFAVVSTEGSSLLLRARSELYDIDTEYSRVQVFRTTDQRTGKEIRAMATDPYFVQSAIFLDSDELVFRYTPFYHLGRHFNPEQRHSLMIGGAGYTFPREFLSTYADAKIDVVEIDPGMTAIARRFFRLRDDPRMTIIHEDGRTFINNAPAATYDSIFLDAFGSLFSVPTHLTTVEAVRHLKRILKPDGLVIVNIGSALSGPAGRFLAAEVATYRAVFPEVLIYKVNPSAPDDQMQNVMLVALAPDAVVPETSSDLFVASLLEHRYAEPLEIAEPVLTDDLAPVEYYNSAAQNRYLADR